MIHQKQTTVSKSTPLVCKPITAAAVPTAKRRQWTDAELLDALHARDVWGWSARKTGAWLGRPRCSVIGALNRIDNEYAASVAA